MPLIIPEATKENAKAGKVFRIKQQLGGLKKPGTSNFSITATQQDDGK